MASKRYTPQDDPPSASSDDDETEDDEQETITQNPLHKSSEEEEEEDESESESESEEEETKTQTQTQNPNSSQKTLTLNSSSIFEFESDVRSPTASDFAIKPSKKVFETPTSKRSLSGSVVGKDNNKKMKLSVVPTVSNGDVDDEKKLVMKRVWSVDDELMLLQGFIEYHSKTGCSPLADMDGFYKFTMSSLPGYATKSQLYEKVRRLKKKFRVNSEKVGASGEEPVFAKAHERKVFEISSKIWGNNGCESVSGGGGGASSKGKVGKVRVLKVKPKSEVKVVVKEKDEDDEKVVGVEDFETLYPYWNAGLVCEVSSALKFPDGVVKLVKENLGLIGEDKARELNEKWKAVFENEAVLRKRRIALLSAIGGVETA